MAYNTVDIALIAGGRALIQWSDETTIVAWAMALAVSGLVGVVGVWLLSRFRAASSELFPTVTISIPDAGRPLIEALTRSRSINHRPSNPQARPIVTGFKAGEVAKIRVEPDGSIFPVRLIDQHGKRLLISSDRILPYDAPVKVTWADSMILAVVAGRFRDGQKYGVILDVDHFIPSLSELQRVVALACDLSEHGGRVDKAA